MQPHFDSFPHDYVNRVYAGVLGKVIGVYLGRPFEGWTYERIQQQLGDIEYYVHDKLGMPLLVTDDDISGTFTFPRVLGDAPPTAADVGKGWLNYLIEDRTILWWGGLGNSTEHTAYLRLKQGIDAPRSGSAALNGKVVSEQIGAQIFIDGWAMVAPGDPDQAAYLAEQAARVSHDGEAVYGAVAWAVMESQAFVDQDTDRLLDLAVRYVPGDSVIRKLIDDVRSWHAQSPDWRGNRELLAAHYGYDKYGGNCHMVPNHGLMVLSLLHAEDDFSQAMKIVNTSGWDTDCNSGNLGCLMGIKLGIDGINKSATGEDWRAPVADRIYVPTADPNWGISDCARETVSLVNSALLLKGKSPWRPKGGAEFHFQLPGSVQGFTTTGEGASIRHTVDHDGALLLAGPADSQFGSPVFTPTKDIAKMFEKAGYALLASPRIHPGQTIEAEISTDTTCCLYLKYYGHGDEPTFVAGPAIGSGQTQRVSWEIPKDCHPIFEVGVAHLGDGHSALHWLTWAGEPKIDFSRPSKGSMWRRAWINGADEFLSWWEAHRIIQNQGRGLVIQGNHGWRDYEVTADVTPHLANAAGIAGRVQGMRRYYGLLLSKRGERSSLDLVCVNHAERVLASVDYAWEFGETHDLKLAFSGDSIQGYIGDALMLEEADSTLTCGSIALVVEEGRSGTNTVRVNPTRHGRPDTGHRLKQDNPHILIHFFIILPSCGNILR
ncbi:MAG: ADP-ribosylglycohydrolase family protein [Pseudomonadota bacterium]